MIDIQEKKLSHSQHNLKFLWKFGEDDANYYYSFVYKHKRLIFIYLFILLVIKNCFHNDSHAGCGIPHRI